MQDLFVSVPADLPTSGQLTWFRTLRTQTTAAGIRVHALGSETSWIDDVPAALRWQSAALGTGLFDGVHLDVEPWLHAAWGGAGQAAMLGRYLDLLDRLEAATPLRVEADIAFWLDQVTVAEGRLDEAVLARVDAVTVMSYRTTVTGPDSITATRCRRPRRGCPGRQAGPARGGDELPRAPTRSPASRRSGAPPRPSSPPRSRRSTPPRPAPRRTPGWRSTTAPGGRR